MADPNRLRTAASLVVMAAALGYGWTVREPLPPAPPVRETATEAEARAVLAGAAGALRPVPDLDRFCGDDQGFCRGDWSAAGGAAAAPAEPPHVLASVVRDGIRVLVVCGRGGDGRVYGSDYPVLLHNGVPEASLPVFWAGRTFSGRGSAMEPAGEGYGSPPVDTGSPACRGLPR